MEVRRSPANWWDVKWSAASFEVGATPDIPLAKKEVGYGLRGVVVQKEKDGPSRS